MAYKPIEAGIISKLLADTAVAAIVGTRVFPVLVPQGEDLPAVTVSRIATERQSTLGLPNIGAPVATIEVRGIAEGYQAAAELASKCRLALDDIISGTFGDHGIQAVSCDDELDEYEFSEMGKGSFHRVLRYVVEYEE